MAKEAISPLAMQIKHASIGGGGLNIFEHRGESGTWYEPDSDVDKGVLKVKGVQVPEDPKLIPIHKDETLSEYTKDGVPVELVEAQVTDRELVDAQMRNDEF